MQPEANQFTLSWAGPFSWVGEAGNLFVSAPPGSGIYVWALPAGDAYLPYYVGETRHSLAARSRAHFQCYCSGMYTIYNASAFKMGRKELVWKGTLYSATFGARLQEFMQRLSELVGHVYGTLAALRVFFAPLELDDRRLRRIEGELAWILAKAPEPVGTFQDEGLSYQQRADHEEALLIKVANAPQGFILPASFEA